MLFISLMKLWEPPVEPSKREQLLLKRLVRTRKLFAFLRHHRHRLFDDEFQQELWAMYRGTGSNPIQPAQLCLALILQGYLGISDAEAVELTVVDARWQMVLHHFDSERPAFSQGALQAFRERLINKNLDKRLLEKTIELAKEHGGFGLEEVTQRLKYLR